MSDLAEFLRARLDHDEERARFVQREQGDRRAWETEAWRLSWHDEYDLLCIEPSRALAEVESKRRLMDDHSGPDIGFCQCNADCPCPTLRLLAFPYASHPAYLEEWRP